MSFTLDLTDEQQQLRDKCHAFARDVIRPVAAEYDREQELPWPVLEEAARQGLYDWQLYAQASTDSEIQRLVIGRALRAAASTEPLDQRMPQAPAEAESR